MIVTASTEPAASSSSPQDGGTPEHAPQGGGFRRNLALAVGSVGVVYGDIGTSPLYALKESIHHVAHDGLTRAEVIGVVSLLIWAVVVVVTLKYVVLIMRADNKGEGGTLSLMALAQKAVGRRSLPIFLLGVMGAALFYGDSIITPAISVLSAVEGLKLVTPVFADQWNVVLLAIAILIALFFVQSRGTAGVAVFFGPIMVVWFGVLAFLGLIHINDDLGILAAFNPLHAAEFIGDHGVVGLIVLGSVFLAVTGAEALYADMGHFGRFPIRAAWLFFVFPALVLNYLGQGAFVLKHIGDEKSVANPFFLLAPEWGVLPLVVLSGVATVIASQAVITGAFSLTQQAVQLGLLPRIEIRHTSETQHGQIYIPQVNRMLAMGVIALVLSFKTSSALASAYGIAVTGAMLADTGLFFVVAYHVWKWNRWQVALFGIPFLAVDLIFFGANCLKIPEGAYMPLIFGAVLIVTMWTWVRGTRIVYDKSRRDSVPLPDLVKMLEKSKPVRVAGTAVFLTSDPETAPGALLHNLKHNKVLHKRNIILTIHTADTPRVTDSEKLTVEDLSEDVKRIIVRVGYMESPRVPHFLALARRRGLDFDIMQTSFFLGKRTIKPAASSGMPLWQDNLFIFLSRTAANATDFFHIPTGRVVELGAQVTV
jgi:KUP system potassium uptake protein